MVSSVIRSVRCDDVLNSFMDSSQGCVFFTLTTPDVVGILEIRKRWRNLRHYLVELFGKDVKYVMNYEIHPNGHGWHIHSVWNRYIPLRTHFAKIQSFGFGRMDVRKVDTQGVSDYLTKHALKAYRGVSRRQRDKDPSFRLRLVNCSRGLPRLSDYSWRSDHKTKVDQMFRDYLNRTGKIKSHRLIDPHFTTGDLQQVVPLGQKIGKPKWTLNPNIYKQCDLAVLMGCNSLFDLPDKFAKLQNDLHVCKKDLQKQEIFPTRSEFLL